jgi:hypothetical protein
VQSKQSFGHRMRASLIPCQNAQGKLRQTIE